MGIGQGRVGSGRQLSALDALKRLNRDVEAASEAKDWKRVLEIVEQYVARGWLDSESGWEHEHRWAYLAHMRSNAHLMLDDLDRVVAIGNEVAERFDGTCDVTLFARSCAVALNKAAANLRLGNFDTAKLESKRIVDQCAEDGTQWYQEEVAAALLLQAKAETSWAISGMRSLC